MNLPDPIPAKDNELANMLLVYFNILWIFGVIWSTWGLGAVVVLAVVINHIITRISGTVEPVENPDES
jgi:hypothetical protein